MDWKIKNQIFGRNEIDYENIYKKDNEIERYISRFKILIQSKKTNLSNVLNLTPGRINTFLSLIQILLQMYSKDQIRELNSILDNYQSATLNFLCIIFTSILIFTDSDERKFNNTIKTIRENKFQYIIKLFVYSNSIRLFLISYYSLPKQTVDSVLIGMKPYTNIDKQGVTAFDLATMCEHFIEINKLKNRVLFLGVFYSNSNFINWETIINTSSCNFQFGLFATGIPTKPKHWVSFLIDKKKKIIYLYDSCNQYNYGDRFMSFIQNNLEFKISRTYKMHQYDSNYCGLYCLLFMALMCTNDNTNDTFDELFVKNPNCMDNYIHLFEDFFFVKYDESDITSTTAVLQFISNLFV